MEALYNLNGQATAYIYEDGKHIYLYNGNPVGFIRDNNIYSYSGRYLGWIFNGWFYDRLGRPAFFTVNSTGGPSKPSRKAKPTRSARKARPAKAAREARPAKPARSVYWSNFVDEAYFAQ